MKKLILLILTMTSVNAWAQWDKYKGSSSGSGSKKPWILSSATEASEAKRFTLSEWLDKKSRAGWSDMWLGYNTNVYEFMLGVNYLQYDFDQKVSSVSTTTTAYNSYTGDFSAYVRNVGLTAQYQQNREEKFDDVTGIFNLRLLGTSMQNSHLTLHYGLRTRTSSTYNYRMNHQFPAATLQLYIMSSFGINGHYRKYLKSFESVNGDTEGTDLTAGVFIEFGSLRLTGSYFEEYQSSLLNNITTEINRKGTKVGLQIFF